MYNYNIPIFIPELICMYNSNCITDIEGTPVSRLAGIINNV